MEFQTPLVFSGQKVKAGTTITMPLRPPADMVCALSFPICSKVGKLQSFWVKFSEEYIEEWEISVSNDIIDT